MKGRGRFAAFCMALPAAAVHRHHREGREIDMVDGRDVERDHLGAVGLGAAREHLNPAFGAELVADGVLVEEIFLQHLGAGAKLKILRRQEREVQALLGADRAVARRDGCEIGGAFITHLAAMAATGVSASIRHPRALGWSVARDWAAFTAILRPLYPGACATGRQGGPVPR